ncbi:hypothetical protein [Plantactinospora sp. GCM10030261]|uniref:hypothetical protein n=1 Tax=Plantactinospora sp. GCM10030261 TaxID=3273420 RepID=UPI0036112D19
MELERWLRHVQPWLVGLESAIAVDFSRASLAELEELAAEGDHPGFDAYLGETLLRVGGGRWVEVDGAPAVTADPSLGLSPVVPADLLAEPGRAVEAYDEWTVAVAARREAVPGWHPVKEPTPGLDKRTEPVVPPELRRWLAERESGFLRWAARWAPEGRWDFSTSSLDELGELLVRVLGDESGLRDPANRDFVDGAIWYVGEVYRRVGGGQWSWEAKDGKPPVPLLVNLGGRRRSQAPLVQLEMGMGTSGYLRSRCESFAR